MSDRLQNTRSKLKNFTESQGGRADGKTQEAVAEAYFRLGVHPETLPQERLACLYQAYKRDGANPKYAYHLGRLYFLHGELEQAAHWLTQAVRLCPTSHRIWTHISLLHRELNIRYKSDKNNDQFEPDALKKRGEDIANKIRQGKDKFGEAAFLDFKPPRSKAASEADARANQRSASHSTHRTEEKTSAAVNPLAAVERITNQGQCRWSGIHDLDIEVGMEDSARVDQQEKLNSLLKENLERRGQQRKNGLSAFVILAIEWLAAGYSVPVIRRFMQSQERIPDSPAWSLLDTVCQLYEAETSILPDLLAQTLNEGRIPPLLAALIHRQRLLWRPLEFEQTGGYYAARKSLMEIGSAVGGLTPEQTEQLNAYRNSMQKFLGALRKPVLPPKPIKDVAIEEQGTSGKSALSPVEKIAQLDALVKKTSAQLDDYWRLLVEALPDERQRSGGTIRAYLLQVEKLTQLALDEIRQLRASGEIDSHSEAQLKQLDQVEATYRNTQLGKFHRKLKQLSLPEITPAEGMQAENIKLFSALETEAQPSEALTSSPEEKLTALDTQAEEFKTRLDDYWQKAKALPKEDERPLTAEEVQQGIEIGQYIRLVNEMIQQSLTEIDGLRSSGKIQNIDRLDQVQAKYQRFPVGNFKSKLKRIKLPDVSPGDAPALANHPDVSNAMKAGTLESSGNGSEQAAQPARDGPNNDLAELMEQIDAEIDRLFTAVSATFDAYSAHSRQSMPIQTLYHQVCASEAETYYRMGRRQEALRLWDAMLVEEPLNLAVLKNIAVCKMGDPEVGQALSAWRSYCERVYAHAVIVGDPSYGAKMRADFHHKYASAFLPADFDKKPGDGWFEQLDRSAVIAFLQSPARWRSFIDHTLLEFYNRKLDFSSPPLILGIARSEDESARLKAKVILADLTSAVGELLPKQISQPFAKICADYFDKAYESCHSVENLIGKNDPNYAIEYDRQLHWVLDLLLLIHKFRITFSELLKQDKDILGSLSSFETIEQLDRLVHLPVELSLSFLRSAGSNLGINDLRDLEDFLDILDQLKQGMVSAILASIFGKSEPSSSKGARHRQYRRLVEYWIKQPSLEKFSDIVDDPQPFYSPGVISALQSQKHDAKAVEELREWNTDYPELAGPACYLATLLMRDEKAADKKFEETNQILKFAIENGLSQKGREQCKELLAIITLRIANKTHNYAEAIGYARQALWGEPESYATFAQLLGVYQGWIEYDPNRAIGLIPQILEDLDKWKKLNENHPPDEQLAKSCAQAQQLVVYAALAKQQVSKSKEPSEQDLKSSRQALMQILTKDSGNLQAVYCQMTTCWNLGGFYVPKSLNQAKPYYLEAEQLADRILAESQQADQRKNAQTVKDQAKQIKERS